MRLTLAGKVVYLRKALDHPQTIARLRKLNLDLGLHKSGNIYRRATISSFRLGILNAHIGLLPKYRGRSVMEWALLQGDAIGISVFFVDEGIDDSTEGAFDVPAAGEIAVEEVGDQGDEVDEEGDVEQLRVAVAAGRVVFVIGEHAEEDGSQHKA